MNEIRILSPQGMLGYGFPVESFNNGIKKMPHAICVDAGSTDGGPHKLGMGVGITSKKMVKRDLSLMLQAGQDLHIPILIGSAGGSGGVPHVKWTLDIIEELVREKDWKLKIAVINATINKDWLKKQVSAGEVKPLPGVPELTADEVDLATEIVAQMGYESYLPALEAGVDVIVGGRSYDPAMTAAVCAFHGMDIGLAYHMGKILECGALCAVPGSCGDCIMGYIHENDFVVESLNIKRFCTVTSVAAHTLYEKSHPYLLPGPGGVTDLEHCTFSQVDPYSVKVKGSKFHRSEEYVVKLEGAKSSGHRSIFIAGVRDPLEIKQIDEIIEYSKEALNDTFSYLSTEDYFVDYKIYGRNGVMAELEPQKEITSQELCLIVEVVSKTKEESSAICAYLRSSMLHYHYEGRYATAGNFAFPFAPSDFYVGEAYEFNVYHLVPLDKQPQIFFKTTYRTLS